MDLLKQWGQKPKQAARQHYRTLANYQNSQFQNQIETPALAEGENLFKALWSLWKTNSNSAPQYDLPHLNTDLKNLDLREEVLVWFGHSSYFIQVDGMRFLIDPVFSGGASPIPHSIEAFKNTDQYKVVDLPEIDVLLISHDHWDHLDYKTIVELEPRVKRVVCGLGVGQHFEYWGWESSKICERNWWDEVEIACGFQIVLTPARHFSGRVFQRNTSLWTSFVLRTPSKRLFLGGDSGYGPHFKEIGQRFGPFDLAVLECGQYNVKWPYIHSFPAEVIREVDDLQARCCLPVHHSKFKLAQHPWNEPLEELSQLAKLSQTALATPKIGEKVDLNQWDRVWEKWW